MTELPKGGSRSLHFPAGTWQATLERINRQGATGLSDTAAEYAYLIETGNRFFGDRSLAQAEFAYAKARTLRKGAVSSYSMGLVREASGDAISAAAFFHEALSADMGFLPARINLGNLLRLPQPEAAAHHHTVALGLAPGHMLALYNLGLTLLHRGRRELAWHLLSQCRSLFPGLKMDPLALAALEPAAAPSRPKDAAAGTDCGPARAAMEADRPADAAALFREALTADTGGAADWCDYGNALFALGRFDEAAAASRRALALQPGFGPALHNLGTALCAMGDAGQGASLLRDGLAMQPRLLRGWSNLGNAYVAAGRPDLAADAYYVATLLPDAVGGTFAQFADHARSLGRLDLAVEAMDRLEPVLPDDYMVPNNRGTYLLDWGRPEQAMANFRRAAELRPSAPMPWSNQGAVHELTGRYEDARAAYAKARALGEDGLGTLARLTHASQHACRWDGIEALFDGVAAGLAHNGPGRVQPFSLLPVPGVDATAMLGAARVYGAQFARPDAARPARRAPGGRPRIGYVSSDLYNHATAYLMAEVLEHHDRAAVEIFVYSYGTSPEDETRARLRRASEHFVDVASLSDDEAAVRIRDDGIDVLIDLKGYTRGGRPGIFARRPAPVQVNYLGFPGSMGADFIDYILADGIVIPPELERHYSEKVLRLPHCYQPNDRKRPLPPAPPRAELGLPPDGIVFCSFNNAYKITPDVFDIWCGLLRQVPGSVLWVLSANTDANGNLRREAAARDVDPARLVFAGRMDLAPHMARFRCADLFLDTFPCTAHTTASDALWCGVPVVTRMGDTFASRVASSILHAAGLPQLVAEDAGEYAALALRLATHPDELAALERHLEEVRLTCPLFDSAAYTRDLEALCLRALDDLN